MPSRRQAAGAFRPSRRPHPSVLLNVTSRDSMASTAFNVDDAHAMCLWLSLAGMKWTMHSWHLASGSIAFTVETSHGAPVTDHEPDSFQPAFDQALDELLPAGAILFYAFGDADDLTMAGVVSTDHDQDADVLHAAAPCALVLRPIHADTDTRAPSTSCVTSRYPVHLLRFIVQRIGGYPLVPRRSVLMSSTCRGAHTGQI